MTSETIQKYSKYSTPKLKLKAQTVFNAWIRKRDENLPCISCSKPTFDHAGHYYSGGHYSGLRFNEFNVNGQCIRCNNFLHGNLIGYRNGLIKKYGEDNVAELDMLSVSTRMTKNDRFLFISICENYKLKM